MFLDEELTDLAFESDEAELSIVSPVLSADPLQFENTPAVSASSSHLLNSPFTAEMLNRLNKQLLQVLFPSTLSCVECSNLHSAVYNRTGAQHLLHGQFSFLV